MQTMAQRLSRSAVLGLFFFFLSAGLLHAQFPQIPQIPGLGGKSNNAAGLDDAKIASGLKEALSVGTQKAVRLVDKPGGYLDNEAIKILLPQNLRPVEKVLRGLGQGEKIDEFVASMNHAAESAAPEAEKIFGDAVKAMTIDDARRLLNGGDTSITEYFKSKTSTELATAFRPHVEAAMNKNGVTQQYQQLVGQVPKMPFGNSSSMDINTYVVNKALDGLFYMLGQQEKEIRTNPAARSTALLKQVFGH
jgi:Protein of unknown function (DUF4197)